MKKLLSALLAIALASLALLAAGCGADPNESTIPWSQPKDWEGGIPGMGGTSR